MAPTPDFSRGRCVPCEGGIPPMPLRQVKAHLKKYKHWKLMPDEGRIRRTWAVKDYLTALDFFRRIGEIAEREGHHPDLHLVGYRHIAVDLWTHAVGGLTDNDFIMAAKIDKLPVKLQK